MSERETPEFAGMNPREKLEAAVADPFYQRLSYGTLPLTPGRLAQDLEAAGVDPYAYVNPSLGILEDTVGWPDNSDSFRLLRRRYVSDKSFLAYWGGPRPNGDHDALGAFPDHLVGVPPTASELVSGNPPPVDDIPLWKVRLNALMPGLVEGITHELEGADTGFAMRERLLDDPKLLRAVHMGYQIGGRLVKPEDNRTHAGLRGGSNLKDIELITDVHKALTERFPLVNGNDI
jgi:hypothetical protein